MYEDLKSSLKKQIAEHEQEREICLKMKPKPLTVLAEKNFYYSHIFRRILRKVEEIEKKELKK